MMSEEAQSLSQPLPRVTEPHESVIPLSQPVTPNENEIAGSNESRRHTRSTSQPPAKARKRTRASNDVPESDRDILLKIVAMVTGLDQRVSNIETSVTELKNIYVEKDVDIDIQLQIPQILSEIQSIKDSLTAGTTSVGSRNPDPVNETGEDARSPDQMDTSTPDVNVKPAEVIPEWETFLNNRKNAFRKFTINSGKLDLFTDWLARTPPFIPAEFLPKEIKSGESERVYEVRRNQKRAELDSQMELLSIRKEEGKSAFLSVDSFIEESINDLLVSNETKASLKDVYNKQIKEGETIVINQWNKQKKGLEEKPERETTKKIVVSEERVYAKSMKKDKPNKSKPKPPTKEPPKEPVKENVSKKPSQSVNVDSRAKDKVSGKWEKSYSNKNRRKNYAGQVQHHFTPWNPYLFSVPPPEMMPPPPVSQPQYGQPTVEKQPENPYFHWATPTNRWKHLSPNTPI